MRRILILLSCFAGFLLTTQQVYAKYIPEEGDIIFHTSNSNLSAAIQAVTHSPYSHMGIVLFKEGQPYVFEAVNPVKYTPLDKWIKRGNKGKYVVKRLNTPLTTLDKKQLNDAAQTYIGKPYDIRFEWSDQKIYCSELVWKMYHDALDIKLATLDNFGSYDVSHPIVAKKVKEIYGNHFPVNEKVIAPVAIYDSPLLMTVATD
ncbi:YiiX family permuted papain-like enzyme [Thorsellia anophelis]|uniref:Permuted papain-like amidase enzyme, YaeF/YiiX, C92 family n=1 Tax=Thorsellia anophelis DSM 18579 TaxID=1123402 RepID=A0A1I0G4S4_9GAMM|nr:YiiX family permuted papain-like enzyme [Thorsellia anophelis]SET64871.1 Permuted papain-like amidase enzyme, YaeF/YiiX, C92 family [Thorsellia anophelis DSM 18579]